MDHDLEQMQQSERIWTIHIQVPDAHQKANNTFVTSSCRAAIKNTQQP